MSDYINRLELVNSLTAWVHDSAGLMSEQKAETIYKVIDGIDAMPAAAVAPVRHGRWKWLGPNLLCRGEYWGSCSICRERMAMDTLNYCPNCGSKMNLEEDS